MDLQLLDIEALPQELCALLPRLLPVELERLLADPAGPGERGLYAIQLHLSNLLAALNATVPRWLSDDLEREHMPLAHGGEATLLFADVTGFTPLNERLDALG